MDFFQFMTRIVYLHGLRGQRKDSALLYGLSRSYPTFAALLYTYSLNRFHIIRTIKHNQCARRDPARPHNHIRSGHHTPLPTPPHVHDFDISLQDLSYNIYVVYCYLMNVDTRDRARRAISYLNSSILVVEGDHTIVVKTPYA